MIGTARGRPSYDVMFYLPSVTPLVTQVDGRPAGGAETQIVLLARALATRGLRVCLVAFPAHGIPASVDGVDIVVRPPFKAHQRLVGKIREVARIGRAISRVDAKTVVVRVAGPQVGLAALAAKVLRRRYVYSSANIFDFDFAAIGMKRRDLLLYRLGVGLADAIIVQTEEQAALCRRVFNRSAIVIRSITEPAERIRRPEALVWIGRLVDYKQPLAFVELARAMPDVPCRLVGVATPESGRVPEDVMRAAAGVPNLELLEPRPRAEVLDVIDRAAVVVNTSLYEGMPNVFLEGWTRGIPGLALHHDPDSVIERFGLGAFAHGSFERLVEEARAVWESRDDQREVAARCRRYVAAEHAADAVAAAWQQALRLAPRVSVGSLEERAA